MQRIPEAELMEEDVQARAYAQADFAEPHNMFVSEFQKTFGAPAINGAVLDLGCGPGDVIVRLARALPQCRIHGVDGSKAMLKCGRELLEKAPDVAGRLTLLEGVLPNISLPLNKYEIVISNSLLHHLHNPQILWTTINRFAGPGAAIFVMDLLRPESERRARAIVRLYAAQGPEILQRDFYNSLLAAFSADEIRAQLKQAQLENLSIQTIGDRHVIISGRINC